MGIGGKLVKGMCLYFNIKTESNRKACEEAIRNEETMGSSTSLGYPVLMGMPVDREPVCGDCVMFEVMGEGGLIVRPLPEEELI